MDLARLSNYLPESLNNVDSLGIHLMKNVPLIIVTLLVFHNGFSVLVVIVFW